MVRIEYVYSYTNKSVPILAGYFYQIRAFIPYENAKSEKGLFQ